MSHPRLEKLYNAMNAAGLEAVVTFPHLLVQTSD
jgi:hypothetical protein